MGQGTSEKDLTVRLQETCVVKSCRGPHFWSLAGKVNGQQD
jgi:hypothetical protein